jgi:hypothetical protein
MYIFAKFFHMGRLVVELDVELEKAFRDEVAKRLGMKKGNIKIAMEQAIIQWIRSKS